MPEQINVVGTYKTKDAVAQPNRASTRFVVIHHAAAWYAKGGALLAIFKYHSGKWPDYGRIGYHEVVQEEADGRLQRYLVNPPEMVGAGVMGQNEHCYHICAATHFQGQIPPQNWVDALARAAADAKKRYPNAVIVGHQEITIKGYETDCPGTRWLAWKPGFVAQVNRIFVPVPPPPAPTPDPWAAWGNDYPLPADQRRFGIPALWFENRHWLKEARSFPWYPPGVAGFVAQLFQGGLIWGVDNVYQVKQFTRELP